MSKIAIVADSGCNVPPEVVREGGIYILPLKIHSGARVLRDGIDISPEEIYETLAQEMPKTSLPTGEEIMALFAQIKADGFDSVCVVNLSSQLSGTYNVVRLLAEEQTDLAVEVIDSKNIAIGAGFLAVYARSLVQAGASFSAVCDGVRAHIEKSRVFFCVDTLEYLRKGGRIGLVASFFGTKLNLKPVISCNPDGVYYTVAKSRGKARAVEALIESGKAHVAAAKDYVVCVSNGGASAEEFGAFLAKVKAAFPTAAAVYETKISATLAIHTGPGLLGLGVHVLA